MVAAPNCNSLLIRNKPIFAGETTGSLFVLGEHIIFDNKTTLEDFSIEKTFYSFNTQT